MLYLIVDRGMLVNWWSFLRECTPCFKKWRMVECWILCLFENIFLQW